jgi:hypothetical protein
MTALAALAHRRRSAIRQDREERLMAGHLDMKTGKWVDDPEEVALRSVDVSDDGLVHPTGAPMPKPTQPESAPPEASGAIAAAGPSAPSLSAPLTAVERAKLMQFVQSGKGNQTAVGVAQSMLADSARGVAGAPGGASAGPSAPQAPSGAQGEISPALSPAQKAVILRARMRTPQQASGPLAMTNQTEGVH